MTRFLDSICLLLALSVACLACLPRHPQATVAVLLDRPRGAEQSSDFVGEFLRITQTEHDVEEGFVVLKRDPTVCRRLMKLLAGLHACLDVNVENRRRLPKGEGGKMLTCVPLEDGSVQVLPAGNDSGTASQRAENLEQERVALLRQKTAVAEAIRTLRPAVASEGWSLAWFSRDAAPVRSDSPPIENVAEKPLDDPTPEISPAGFEPARSNDPAPIELTEIEDLPVR